MAGLFAWVWLWGGVVFFGGNIGGNIGGNTARNRGIAAGDTVGKVPATVGVIVLSSSRAHMRTLRIL
jgi:hypothetical protein